MLALRLQHSQSGSRYMCSSTVELQPHDSVQVEGPARRAPVNPRSKSRPPKSPEDLVPCDCHRLIDGFLRSITIELASYKTK